MRSLAEILRTRLRDLGVSQETFAKRVGIPPTKLSAVMTGKRPLSRRRLRYAPRWCEALGLVGIEATEFIDAMHVDAATPQVRALIARLDRDREALRIENERLDARREELLRMIEGWRRDPPG